VDVCTDVSVGCCRVELNSMIVLETEQMKDDHAREKVVEEVVRRRVTHSGALDGLV
jgi:hypothetical protein